MQQKTKLKLIQANHPFWPKPPLLARFYPGHRDFAGNLVNYFKAIIECIFRAVAACRFQHSTTHQ